MGKAGEKSAGIIIEGIANTKANVDLHTLRIFARIISIMGNVRLKDATTDTLKGANGWIARMGVQGKGAYIFTIVTTN